MLLGFVVGLALGGVAVTALLLWAANHPKLW